MTKAIILDEPVILDDRFWSKVNKNTESGCWLWTSCVQAGYGRFRYKKRTFWVHRLSYLFLIGDIPEGLQLDHLCRVRNCVNPEHLEPVTSRENTMRGNSFSAQNAKKTHCPQGHEYNEENTYIYNRKNTTYRKCKICTIKQAAEWHIKKKKMQNL
jgi:hypothetical protein